MAKERKVRVLALLSVVVVILIVLSASLPQLEFRAGRPFSLGGATAAISEGSGLQGDGGILLVAFRGVLTLALIGLPVYIVINLLTPEGRRRLLANLVAFLLIVLLLNLLPKNPQPPPTEETQTLTSPLTSLLPGPSEPTDQFVARVPPWLDLFAAVALAVLVAGVVAGGFWWLKRRATFGGSRRLEQLAQQAQETIDALRAGDDITDTIIRSYIQMSQILQQERGIHRENAMTPHEFEQHLTAQGLPPAPVQQLTRLFESVRYGHQPAGKREEALAITSLEAIIAHCRGGGQA